MADHIADGGEMVEDDLATQSERELALMLRLAPLVSYCPTTGRLTWLRRDRELFKSNRAFLAWNTRNVGRQVGHITEKGYWRGVQFGRCFTVHRLIFFIAHGYLPVQVDHVNRDPSDNRLENLREATGSQNCANRGKCQGGPPATDRPSPAAARWRLEGGLM